MRDTGDHKEQHLQNHGVFNAAAGAVVDPLFRESEFFDPRDVVLVKYEMLRRAQVDGISAASAAQRFGFSRAAFYKARSAFHRLGLIGLIPARPGPRHAHKLTDDVLDFIDQQVATHGKLPSPELAVLILDQREMHVHPRSIERALARREKRGR